MHFFDTEKHMMGGNGIVSAHIPLAAGTALKIRYKKEKGAVLCFFGDGAIHQATVALVDPMGDAASGTFGVRLRLPNPERRIPAGLKCRVDLSTGGPVLSDSRENQEDSPRLAATER